MHKSKNYDMATQVAMDKLMPKPIQITISMQGGGGLSGLGERPISSVYGRPIPRTIYRDNGGGILGINKPININGQSHSLAWINPGEASALKAMGGSGKKVDGIPAYDTNEDMWSDYQGGVDIAEATGDTSYPDTYPGSDFTDTEEAHDTWLPERAEIIGSSGTTENRRADPRQFYDTQIRESLAAGEDPRTTTKDQNLMQRTIGYLTGGSSDKQVTEKQSELMNTAKKVAYTHWRNTAGKYSLDAPKDYDDWFAAQDPNALIAGLSSWRGPAGMAMQSSFDNVNNELKKRFEERASEKSEFTGEELTKEELADIVESAKVEGLQDFTPYSEMSLPGWVPGGTWISGAANFFSRTVIGTGTVGGVGVHVHKDGSITVISPEDAPGYDHESMKGENVEPIKRRRRGLSPPSQPASSEAVAPAKGTMAELLSRQGPTDKLAGKNRLAELLASLYPNQNINIG